MPIRSLCQISILFVVFFSSICFAVQTPCEIVSRLIARNQLLIQGDRGNCSSVCIVNAVRILRLMKNSRAHLGDPSRDIEVLEAEFKKRFGFGIGAGLHDDEVAHILRTELARKKLDVEWDGFYLFDEMRQELSFPDAVVGLRRISDSFDLTPNDFMVEKNQIAITSILSSAAGHGHSFIIVSSVRNGNEIVLKVLNPYNNHESTVRVQTEGDGHVNSLIEFDQIPGSADYYDGRIYKIHEHEIFFGSAMLKLKLIPN